MSNVTIPDESMAVVHKLCEMQERLVSLEATKQDWLKQERLANRYLGWVRDNIEGLNTPDGRSN